jgi:hypothetical protein
MILVRRVSADSIDSWPCAAPASRTEPCNRRANMYVWNDFERLQGQLEYPCRTMSSSNEALLEVRVHR